MRRIAAIAATFRCDVGGAVSLVLCKNDSLYDAAILEGQSIGRFAALVSSSIPY